MREPRSAVTNTAIPRPSPSGAIYGATYETVVEGG